MNLLTGAGKLEHYYRHLKSFEIVWNRLESFGITPNDHQLKSFREEDRPNRFEVVRNHQDSLRHRLLLKAVQRLESKLWKVNSHTAVKETLFCFLNDLDDSLE